MGSKADCKNSALSRRGFLSLAAMAAAGSGFALCPGKALAEETSMQVIRVGGEEIVAESSNFWMPTENEVAVAQQQAEEEAARLVAELEKTTSVSGIQPFSRQNDFKTVYGKKELRWSKWKYLPGQHKGGMRITPSGSLHYTEGAGGTFSFSISINGVSVGFSTPLAKKTASGASVNISGSGFYKLRQRNQLLVTPFTIYRKGANGKFTAIKKSATAVIYSPHIDGHKVRGL